MSPAETVEALVKRGVPRPMAEAQHGANRRKQAPTIEQPTRQTVSLPLMLVLPWSMLVSVDDRYGATMRNGRPLLILTARYREAGAKIRDLARRAAHDNGPDLGRVKVEGHVFVPDNRIHDTSNFAKLVEDSLQRIVYQNDAQVKWSSWQEMGVDVDRPRAEVRISRLVW